MRKMAQQYRRMTASVETRETIKLKDNLSRKAARDLLGKHRNTLIRDEDRKSRATARTALEERDRLANRKKDMDGRAAARTALEERGSSC